MRRSLAILAATLATTGAAAADAPPVPDFDPGLIADPVVLMPEGPATGTVFLLSDGDGWGDAEAALAARLRHANAVVVGIDLPRYFPAIDAGVAVQGKACAYLVADFERIGHALQRATGADTFHAPILAGFGEGGALAIDVLSQTPADTLGGVIAANPTAGETLTAKLCTKAERSEASDGGGSYALPAGAQPAPLTLVLGSDASADATARADALGAAGVSFTRKQSPEAGEAALGDAVASTIAEAAVAGDAPSIVELPTEPKHDAMAIMLSGDGGWRDLDKTVAGLLRDDGVPTVGLDSLRWFWSKRTPEETGRELARLIDVYTERWDVQKVILAGYSFGASVLPAAFLAMPPETQAKVSEISLLAPGATADWEITVSGWLGSASSAATPTGPEIAALPADLVQCIHGDQETDSACPGLDPAKFEVISTKGGHHFDGDYPAIAQHILDGLATRVAAAP